MSSKIQIQKICEFCGNEFAAQTTVTCFCGYKCTKGWKQLMHKNGTFVNIGKSKYPEMVAEIFPHFEGGKLYDFGKENFWFVNS